MALDLNGYIKQSYQRPNRKVLEGLGASEDLIEYLMETPGNTNWNVIGSIGEGGGGDAEVWLTGDTGQEMGGATMFTLSNVGETDYLAELLANGENYQVFMNGEELPYFIRTSESGVEAVGWTDTDDESTATKAVSVGIEASTLYGQAIYIGASTAPTSVEVSVKAK